MKPVRSAPRGATAAVPASGSLAFSVDIEAETPGTEPGHVASGCYGPSWSWQVGDPGDVPWSRTVLEGQQAGVVINMITVQTGPLLDWFISGSHAFALIERLPSTVTGSPGVGLDLAYTQIVAETPVAPGRKHAVAIRYRRGFVHSDVEPGEVADRLTVARRAPGGRRRAGRRTRSAGCGANS